MWRRGLIGVVLEFDDVAVLRRRNRHLSFGWNTERRDISKECGSEAEKQKSARHCYKKWMDTEKRGRKGFLEAIQFFGH